MNAKQLTASFATVSLVATLGLVACDRAKTQATNDQPTTVGQKVDNAIDKTSQKLSEAGDKTIAALNEAGHKTEAALAKAGDKIAAKTDEITTSISTGDKTTATGNTTTPAMTATPAPTSTTKESRVSDAAITASVKTDLLKDPDLSVLKIDVDTKGGVVTLNGLANDEPARQRAEKMASAVKGVKEVRNFLVIKRA